MKSENITRKPESAGKPNWTIETRFGLLSFGTDKIEFSDDLSRTTILRLNGPTGQYYEGFGHEEIVLMLDDFEKTHGFTGKQIILVNVDEHDDMKSLVDSDLEQYHKPQFVDECNCIRKTADMNLCNSETGLYWIFRRINERMALSGPNIDLPRTTNFRTIKNFYDTGITMHLLDFDAINTDTNCASVMNELFALKEKGFLIATSIDFDAGRQSADYDPHDPDSIYIDKHYWDTKLFNDEDYDRDLAATDWLLELCRHSAVVMTFHSGYHYCDPRYAKEQGERFQHLCLNGYRANLPHLAGEIK